MSADYHESHTRIVGDVIGKARCHEYGGGHVANFVVSCTRWGHTEEYKCVAFGDLGTDIKRQIKAGQVVSCSGYMKTTTWKNDPAKENHQLIVEAFEVVRNHLTTVKSASPKRPTNRRNTRKPKQTAIDFRAIAEPEFNDELPPL